MNNFLEPNVVVIDDKQDEIEGILKYYTDRGIGCKFLNSDLIEGDDHPETPYSDTNVIFLDLYYSDFFDPEICASWIRHIVNPRSFYILVMWTKDETKASDVSDILTQKQVVPFLTIVKSKIDYQTATGYDFSSFLETLNQELKSTAPLEEILLWKRTLKYSSNAIIGNITKDPDNILNKLKKIIISHGGSSLKESKDDVHKRSVLFDALDTVLVSNTKKNYLGEISEVNSSTLYDLSNIANPEIDKELNSWFHFKLDNNLSVNAIVPGLIAKNNHSFFKRLYSIKDDSKIENVLKKQVDDNKEIIDIVLIISRPCDIAQKKYGKNIKLLSGVLIKNPKRKQNNKLDWEGTLSDSMKVYDHLYFDDDNNDITIMFDFRYSFSVPSDLFIEKFENIKIFNKELLSELQVEYSNYSSRLGVTQII